MNLEFVERIGGEWHVLTQTPIPEEIKQIIAEDIWELIIPIIHSHMFPFVGENYIVTGGHE